MEELLGNSANKLAIIDLKITAKEAELKALQLEREATAAAVDPKVIQQMLDGIMSQMKGV